MRSNVCSSLQCTFVYIGRKKDLPLEGVQAHVKYLGIQSCITSNLGFDLSQQHMDKASYP